VETKSESDQRWWKNGLHFDFVDENFPGNHNIRRFYCIEKKGKINKNAPIDVAFFNI